MQATRRVVMKEVVGLFMLLYTLGQVALDRERPEVFLQKLDRYSKGTSMCPTAGQYTPVVKVSAPKSTCNNHG
jgi:hypothetical protein